MLVSLSLFTLIYSTIAVPEKNSRSSFSKVVKGRSTEKTVKTQEVYDKAIHGPNKAFRVSGPEAHSFVDSEGSFNHQSYHYHLTGMVSNQKATRKRMLAQEIVYRKRSFNFDNQSDSDHDKRGTPSGYGTYEIDSDICYATEMIYSIGIGTPVVQFPLVIDLGIYDTIVSTIPSDGVVAYDAKKSNSSIGYPTPVSETFWLDVAVGVLENVNVAGTFVQDVISFLPGMQSFVALFLAVGSAVAIPVVAGAIIVLPRIILGMAPPGDPALHVPALPHALPPVPAAFPMGNLLWIQQQVPLAQIFAAQLAVFAPFPPNAAHAAKRSLSTNTPYSEVLFGGTDPKKYIAPLLFFPVVSAPGITQKLAWQILMGTIQTGSGVTKLSIGIIQVDLRQSHIYVDPILVQQLYANIPNSKAPTARNPFYTFYCRTPPTVSFNLVDINGISRLLTLNADDWNVAQSFDSPGWCIGAVQALPLGATHAILGLQFLRTFYSSYQIDKVGQGQSIGFAVSTRQ